MFEESLITAKMAQVPRRRKTYLSLAFLLHAFGFLAMLFVQYWTVEALQAPPIPVSFFTSMQLPAQPPPPAPRPAEPVTAPPEPQAPPTAPVQPQDVPQAEPQPETRSETLPVTMLLPTSDSLPSTGGDYLPGPPNSGAAPAEEEDPGILVVGGAVSRPVALSQPQPRYSDVAKRVRLQGQVVLEAIIDKNGNVVDVKVRRGLPYGLSEEAVKAVQQWKFEPAKLNGKPVAVFYTLTVKFALQ